VKKVSIIILSLLSLSAFAETFSVKLCDSESISIESLCTMDSGCISGANKFLFLKDTDKIIFRQNKFTFKVGTLGAILEESRGSCIKKVEIVPSKGTTIVSKSRIRRSRSLDKKKVKVKIDFPEGAIIIRAKSLSSLEDATSPTRLRSTSVVIP
jgi:hypothetical protein